MSEERFDRIDQRLEQLASRVESRFDDLGGRIGALDARTERIENGVRALDSRTESRFGAVEDGLRVLDARTESLAGQISALDAHTQSRFAELESRMDGRFKELGADMRELHADAIEKIKAVAEYAVLLDEKMARGFAEVKKVKAREVDPIKSAIRDHTARIERLEKRRG